MCYASSNLYVRSNMFVLYCAWIQWALRACVCVCGRELVTNEMERQTLARASTQSSGDVSGSFFFPSFVCYLFLFILRAIEL